MAKDELFSDENIPQSNWFKFEKVGDKIKGTLTEKYEKAGQDQFPAQIVYVIKNTEDGELWNVGVKKENSFVNDRLKNVEPGMVVGLLFKEEIPAKVKGYNAAKSIVPYVGEKDESFEVATEDAMPESFE